MRLLIATAVATPLLLSSPGAAEAQSFLEGMARQAADRLAGAAAGRAEEAAADLISGRGGRPDAPADDERGASALIAAPAAEPLAAAGPAPWPLNAGRATYTGDLEFSPADQARAEGLHAFAKVECSECEGGYTFDSWINFHTDMDVDGVAAHVGGLGVGEALEWTGVEASGRLEVVSEAPVGRFACKQVRTVMTRGEAAYETPGLYCFGKSHAFAREMWVKVL